MDLIDRQAAIEALGEKPLLWEAEDDYTLGQLTEWRRYKEALEALPSAQPETCTVGYVGIEVDYPVSVKQVLNITAETGALATQTRVRELPRYAQPERKKGRWIYGGNDGQDGWYCSECGGFVPWDYDYYGLDNIDFIKDFKTCPRCDARMISYTGKDGGG